MGQNLTLNNGESGELLNGDTFGWYTGTSNGAIKLTLALSDLDRVNHTIKITSTWTWKRSSSSGWCWDVNSANKAYKLYATATSSSSGTSQTYYLYVGGNRHSYGTLTSGTDYFNWAAAWANTSYHDINYSVSQKSVTNVRTINLSPFDTLSMNIHCYLDSSSSSSYGPRSDKDWGTFTLTIPEDGHPIWTNVNGTWKGGVPWINVNGTWQSGITWINDGGTWKVLS